MSLQSHFLNLLSLNIMWDRILCTEIGNDIVLIPFSFRPLFSPEPFLSGLNALLVYLIRSFCRGGAESISMQAQLMAAKLIQFIPLPFLRPRL